MTTGFTAAQHDKTSQPLPLEEDFEGASLAQRIWIGNMDVKINEYTMVQILKNYGKIKQFDFLVHKTGALAGQPRGYCFVTFEKEEHAARAILKLDNMRVLSKRLQVRWADSHPMEKAERKETLKLPTDSAVDDKAPHKSKRSPQATIHAIEAKLKEMERTKEQAAHSSSTKLHPLLALSKQNAAAKAAAAAKEASKPYYKKKRRR